MDERSLIFPAAEYQTRTDRLQSQMGLDGLDALLLTTPQDVLYVTGFLTRFWESPARPWFIILPATGAPIAVIPGIGAPLMGRTWITDIRTWDAPDPQDDGVSLLCDTLLGLGAKRIGIPMGLETHLRMPLGDYHRIAAAIAPAEFVDGTNTIQRVREIKSAAEVARIRETCAIAGRAFDRVPEIARAGTPLDHVFRDFQTLLLQEGADWVSYVAGAAGPDGYHDVISPAAPTPLQQGDVLMLDTGAVRDGYFCDYDRNFFIGAASDPLRRTQEALWHATEAALDQLRPGMRAADVHRILSESLTAQGATPAAGRLGHGLGIALTEWPSFTPLDQTELRAGMVLTLEPGAHVTPGTVLVHEENIVLRADGPDLLSPRAPMAGVQIG
ncbi:M24 family metallopeptidase [Tateyamaria sp. SN6-1]|uniref:M24 family metallopeptidase n=1 Tax=Tateyamaria sp. SN6-1 TaxID=3092148 RepID=UPI0039F44F42